MTKTIEKRFEKQEEKLKKKYDNDCELLDATKERNCYAKYFTPWNSWRWYGFQYYKDLQQFYGIVSSPLVPEGEWGYFNLSELEKITGPFGMKIERDLYSTPLPYEKVMEDINRHNRLLEHMKRYDR